MARGSQIVEMSDVLFDIRESPVYVDGEIVPSKKAIKKKSLSGDVCDDTFMSITSNRYVPVSNKNVLDMFGSIADKAGVSWAHGKGHLLRGGNTTIMEIIFPDKSVCVADDDILELRGWLTNSFDGTSSAKLELGFMRLVCTNGMIIGTKDLAISYRHVGDVNERLASEFSTYLNTKVKEATDQIFVLQENSFTEDEQVVALLEEADWMGKRNQEALKMEWVNQGRTLNGWLLYNVFTYIITHHVRASIQTKMFYHKRLNSEVQNWGA